MTASVRISRRAAQTIRDHLGLDLTAGELDSASLRAFDELGRALRPSPKKRLAKAKNRKEKLSDRRAHNAETAEIRAAVVERCRTNDGLCECGCGRQVLFGAEDVGHLDHVEGRVRIPQSVESTWLLHYVCDARRTVNDGGAESWLQKFLNHCQRNGLTGRAACEVRWHLDRLKLGAESEEVGRG